MAKNIIVLIILILLLVCLVLADTRHKPQDNYVFNQDTIICYEDVNYPIIVIDPWTDEPNQISGKFPGNILRIDAALPTGLELSEIRYIDSNNPILTEIADRYVPGPNDLIGLCYLRGRVPAGNYKILFGIFDGSGNDENAYFVLKVLPKDVTPPLIFGCRKR